MPLEQRFSMTRCRFGVARRDVTPPVGINNRCWGAARHDVAEGVHEPLTATAAILAPMQGGPELALVALDLGWYPYVDDAEALLAGLRERLALEPAQLLVSLSHTHAGARTDSTLVDEPGSELVVPYLEHVARQVGDALEDARASTRPAFVSYGIGRCELARNRDLWDSSLGRYVCGYNPGGAADDTVLVARVTADDDTVLATLFNYACHPTTLAWENRLLSPDFVGSARRVLEQAFEAPALFLQGPSGELAPRDQYTGDVAVAERNGRQLGHAAAAAIEALPPPGTRLRYAGAVTSGANLGCWSYEPCDEAQLQRAGVLAAHMTHVTLPVKDELGYVDDLPSTHDPRAESEKARRRELIRHALGGRSEYAMPLWTWRLGEALLVACPNEPYSAFQSELRQRFPGTPLLVLMTTNGGLGYLPPREAYGTGLYQEQQSPFAPGCLERTIDAAADALASLGVPRPASAP